MRAAVFGRTEQFDRWGDEAPHRTADIDEGTCWLIFAELALARGRLVAVIDAKAMQLGPVPRRQDSELSRVCDRLAAMQAFLASLRQQEPERQAQPPPLARFLAEHTEDIGRAVDLSPEASFSASPCSVTRSTSLISCKYMLSGLAGCSVDAAYRSQLLV